MIVDASALIAIAAMEPDARRFAEAMVEARPTRMSAANWFEAAMVADRRQGAVSEVFDTLCNRLGIEIVPVDQDLARGAREAWRRFGRGVHSAKLNFGDCFAYALAKQTGEPLLFKGRDFARTDITPALPPT